MSFSETLKTLLAERDMKAVELARKTGLSEAAISDYINGKKEPRGKQSVEIAKALNVSLDELWETGFGTEKKSLAIDSEAHAEEERRILEKMRSGKNRAFIIGYGKPQKMIELTDEEEAVIQATLQAMREAKAKKISDK